MLETAIDQISNPVAFASLPVDLPRVVDPVHDAITKKQRRRQKEKHTSDKHREKKGSKEGRDRRHSRRTKDDAIRELLRTFNDEYCSLTSTKHLVSDISSSDSFCVITKDGIHDAVSTNSGRRPSNAYVVRPRSWPVLTGASAQECYIRLTQRYTRTWRGTTPLIRALGNLGRN